MNLSPMDAKKPEKTSAAADTPMLRQYHAVKAKNPDGIVLFRLGDFYEMFYADAQIASKILDVTLTARGKGTASHVPMCGFPHHAADAYIAKLIKAGYKVAICEQLENPAEAKGIVKRDVTRVISAGTFLDAHSVEARYLACLVPDGKTIGAAFMDPAEGTIQTHILPDDAHALAEFFKHWSFRECLVPEKQHEHFQKLFKPLRKADSLQLTAVEDWHFNSDIARKNLCTHFGTANLHGFGIEQEPLLIKAASALLEYLKRMNHQPMRHIDRIRRYNDSDYAVISSAAMRGLEMDLLIRTLDATQTAMGRRMFRFWLARPLKNIAPIRARQEAVQTLKDHPDILKNLRALLSRIPDLEKHLSRISSGYTHPKDLLAIRNALILVPEIGNVLSQLPQPSLDPKREPEQPETDTPPSFYNPHPGTSEGARGNYNLLTIDDAPLATHHAQLTIDDIPDLRAYLETTVNPDCPLSKPEGRVIGAGVDAELDRLRDVQDNGHEFLRKHQEEEIRRTGINSLKISFNKIFGYYIEITRANLHLAPPDYIRKQTLVNAERFVTPKLGEYEQIIMTAREKILAIENKIIHDVRQKILDHSPALHALCHQIATIDALCSFGLLAQSRDYVRPEVDETLLIDIRQGRHPVAERILEEDFIPNDTLIDGDENRLIILTGPNMAGKSTWIRQTAILTILAQTGSFIPAQSATIGIADRIFTRIGAHDDITRGQSTFMVEMNETADILNHLTERSLVILDEIGRGTSTYDGLSLAWALSEYLHRTKARTLFATHFHELISLAAKHPGIKNYNVAVKEWDDEIIFLHKIVPGGADDSYGIYVAKLAGITSDVISRAKQILTKLELKDNAGAVNSVGQTQLSFFGNNGSTEDQKKLNKIRQQLDKIDLNNTTPVQAFKALEELKNISE